MHNEGPVEVVVVDDTGAVMGDPVVGKGMPGGDEMSGTSPDGILQKC